MAHMGLQPNKVHTSGKICYKPPFNAIEIVFPTGRVFETGGKHVAVTRLVLEEVTLPMLALAGGLRPLRVAWRRMQNIVANSRLPLDMTIDMDEFFAECHGFMQYEPSDFAGAIVDLELAPPPYTNPRGALLVFGAGAVINVGSASFEELVHTYAITEPLLQRYARPPMARGRKRPAATAEAGKRAAKKARQ
jgi:TATA-box binding protein (TBP) (component of TFIID and TFIIIB)